MQEKSGHSETEPEKDTGSKHRTTTSLGEPEGIVVERWGNPGVLELVRQDPAVVLEQGEVLFKEGDPADYMYVVRFGTLRIRSGRIVYEDAIEGGIVGEMAIVEDAGATRSAMVYALTRSELVKIDEQRFFSLVAETPSFARTVMRVLSRRLRRMDKLYQPDRWTERYV